MELTKQTQKERWTGTRPLRVRLIELSAQQTGYIRTMAGLFSIALAMGSGGMLTVLWFLMVIPEEVSSFFIVAGISLALLGAIISAVWWITSKLLNESFDEEYRRVWTDLMATGLPVMLADQVEVDFPSNYQGPGILTAKTGQSGALISRLVRMSAWHAAVAEMARGNRPDLLERQPALQRMCSADICCGIVVLGASSVGCPVLFPGLVVFVLAQVFAGKSLDQRAALTAYCDFFIDSPQHKRLRGWQCRLRRLRSVPRKARPDVVDILRDSSESRG